MKAIILVDHSDSVAAPDVAFAVAVGDGRADGTFVELQKELDEAKKFFQGDVCLTLHLVDLGGVLNAFVFLDALKKEAERELRDNPPDSPFERSGDDY